MTSMQNIVVLISGRGSNLQALVAADLASSPIVEQRARIAAVISNRPGAGGLDIARAHGIPTRVVDHTAFAGREPFDRALMAAIDAHAPDWVVLAGFMRVLGHDFVLHYAGRLLNIHPSLLPLFPGLHTHERALAAGMRVHGATVHFVTPDLDSGPIVAQAVVPVVEDDTAERLAARVLEQEHRLYPQVLRWLVSGRARLGKDGRVRFDPPAPEAAALVSPPLGYCD